MPLHEICILVSGGARSSEGWQKKKSIGKRKKDRERKREREREKEKEEKEEEEEEEVEEEGRLKWYFASRRIKNEERTRKGEVWWDGEGMILEKEEEEQEETEEDKTVPPPRAKITLKSSSKRFKGLRSGRRKGSPRKKGLTTRWAKASTDYKLGIRVYRMRIPYASSTDFSTLNGACRIREFDASNFSKNATYKFTKAMS
ncbi:hypothetical protein V1477_010484 [Vespula maculifrons]|uniref:Uncharacterized protein n=1 Tax=Vespula maculifrons TaxID=7453 RepID=A0ABD2CAW7_VESMC